jgi:hypothetical protein
MRMRTAHCANGACTRRRRRFALQGGGIASRNHADKHKRIMQKSKKLTEIV